MLLKVANDVYIWGFWPVLAAAGVYLYVDPDLVDTIQAYALLQSSLRPTTTGSTWWSRVRSR